MNLHGSFDDRLGPAVFSVGLLAMAVLEVACGSLPGTTQTGKVQEIVIGAAVAPSEVTLAPGDEVRWVNRQHGPVSIVFLNSIQEQVTCQRGFGLAGVDSFADGATALRALESGAAFDIVISDQTMPGMTGVRLARELAALRADLPILLYTGLSDSLAESELAAAGIRGLLNKPVEPDVLYGLLKAHLQ